MSRKQDRKALGRGLSALLGDPDQPAPASGSAPADTTASVPIDLITAGPGQPRQEFRDEDLQDLARSIREHGIIQPVIVRPDARREGAYQIVAGERRWRAAQIAGLHAMPAIVRQLDDGQVLELAIVENVQRVDLNPIEEARGYAQLINDFGYTQDGLSRVIGKSRSHLSNTMRLLSLPDPIISMVRAGRLTAGHARALVTAADPVALAERAVAKGLTVRQVESLARRVPQDRRVKAGKRPPDKDADTKVLEGDLSAAIGMRVTIDHMPAGGGGEIRIRYGDLDQLDRVCRLLSR